jgi:hypothetical protein
MFEPEVDAAIGQFSKELVEKHPDIGWLLEQMKSGDMGEAEGMAALMTLVNQLDLGSEIERIAEGAFAAVKIQNNQMVPAPTGQAPPLVYKGGDKNLAMMNPLLEGVIAERAQFDGDIPELRSGPMLPGVVPAVPVHTNARDLVAIGQQLHKASKEVGGDLDAQNKDFTSHVDLLLEDAMGQGMDEATALQSIKDLDLPLPPGVDGYKTGHLAALRDVGVPTGSALAALTPEERRESAYTALSTTQGRRSALKVITELVQVGLEGCGHKLDSRAMGRAAKVPVYAEWTVHISGGQSTQSNFSFIDTASKSLCRQLVEQLSEKSVSDPVLEVFPINTVDVRQVGWGARVVSR